MANLVKPSIQRFSLKIRNDAHVFYRDGHNGWAADIGPVEVRANATLVEKISGDRREIRIRSHPGHANRLLLVNIETDRVLGMIEISAIGNLKIKAHHRPMLLSLPWHLTWQTQVATVIGVETDTEIDLHDYGNDGIHVLKIRRSKLVLANGWSEGTDAYDLPFDHKDRREFRRRFPNGRMKELVAHMSDDTSDSNESLTELNDNDNDDRSIQVSTPNNRGTVATPEAVPPHVDSNHALNQPSCSNMAGIQTKTGSSSKLNGDQAKNETSWSNMAEIQTETGVVSKPNDDQAKNEPSNDVPEDQASDHGSVDLLREKLHQLLMADIGSDNEDYASTTDGSVASTESKRRQHVKEKYRRSRALRRKEQIIRRRSLITELINSMGPSV